MDALCSDHLHRSGFRHSRMLCTLSIRRHPTTPIDSHRHFSYHCALQPSCPGRGLGLHDRFQLATMRLVSHTSLSRMVLLSWDKKMMNQMPNRLGGVQFPQRKGLEISLSILHREVKELLSLITHIPRTSYAALRMYGVNEIASYRRGASCIN